MTDDPRPRKARDDDGRPGGGATTPAGGTAVPVDLASDPSTRRAMAMFVAAPVVWMTHFVAVYLVAEAGCTGSGDGLLLFDPPVPAVFTVVATLLAAGACLWITRWEYRHWQACRAHDASGRVDRRAVEAQVAGPLAFAGVLLGAMFLLAVLFVGVPALVLTGC